MKKIHLTESERQKILSLHGNGGSDIVFTNVMTQDEKYVIFMDHLIEIETKTDLGNIWENGDNLYFFFNRLYETSNLPREIVNEATQFLSNTLLLEGKIDLSHLKPLVKQFIKEDFWKDTWVGQGLSHAGNFVKDTAVSTVTGITDTVVSGAKGLWNGIKDAGVAISKGDFLEVLKIIGRGYLWVGRKIRQAAYSTVGMIIDAILIATGYGKVAQVVVWAIVVLVDIYEFISGDFEEKDVPTWMRFLFFGIDLLGLFTAGAAAKAARVMVKETLLGAKTAEEVGQAVIKSPKMMEFLKTMVSNLKGLPAKLSSFSKTLGKGFLGNLFSSGLKGVAKFVQTGLDSIISMFRGPGGKAALKNLGLIGGIHVGTEFYKDYKTKDIEAQKKKSDQQQNQLATAIASKDADYSAFIK
jgi:hypothetical protein